MRDIKFRGQHNGKWIYGFVQFRKKTNDAVMWLENNEGLFTWLHIDKKTVGQFTGLHDKNGAPIFEGDLVKQGKLILTVKFRYGCFFFCSENDNGKVMNQYSVDFHETISQYIEKYIYFDGSFSKIEIIGNIHDK